MTMLIGTGINLVLNPTFIFGFGWGVRGSALATIISQFVTAAWVLSYFFGKKSTLKIRKENLKLRRDVMLEILAIGLSPFLMQIAASVVTILFNKGHSRYGGDIAVAAMGVINSVANLILMPIFGINQGVQPIIGYNYGARKYARVKHALKIAILAATVVSAAGFLFVELLAPNIISVFNPKDKELINAGAYGIRIYLMMLPIIGFQIVSANYFQAVGKPKYAIFLSLSRQVIVLIPLILILPNFFGLEGVWAAGPSADLVASILTGIFLFLELRHLNRKHEEAIA
jgi:putative MATE family efflux protein